MESFYETDHEIYIGACLSVLSINANSPQAYRVRVQNTSYDTYIVYALFQSTGRAINLTLGPIGSGLDGINYDIFYPDTMVCLSAVRQYDGRLTYSSCVASSDTIPIPYMANTKNAK